MGGTVLVADCGVRCQSPIFQLLFVSAVSQTPTQDGANYVCTDNAATIGKYTCIGTVGSDSEQVRSKQAPGS